MFLKEVSYAHQGILGEILLKFKNKFKL